MTFSAFDLNPRLLQGVSDLGFTEPTPIQNDAIPPALAGRDVLACAMTGSGKTAAFLLPILHRLIGKPRGTTRVLVLAPTRELAAQIAEHLEALAAHTGLTGAAVFGGVAMGPQERAFRGGADVLVATPGRLLDHFQYPYAKLDGLEVLVLDEADRMLDMGFLPDVRRVLQHLPRQRQTLFFSATLPPPIVALAREMLHDPAKIAVDRPSAPATGVIQTVFPVAQELKSQLLLELLRRGEVKSALVFTRTKHRANRLADFLARHGVNCDRIHGNRSQGQRTAALAGFKAGEIPVLVATDIAARGIDVEMLSHVVNFDVPNVPDDYIHRVGRTGRAEATGDALTFVSPEELGELAAIERAIGKRLPRQTLIGFDYTRKAAERLEIPHAERIAAIRARKSEERARARAKTERREQQEAAQATARAQRTAGSPARGQRPAGAAGDTARGQRPAGTTARPQRGAGHPTRGRRGDANAARGPRLDGNTMRGQRPAAAANGEEPNGNVVRPERPASRAPETQGHHAGRRRAVRPVEPPIAIMQPAERRPAGPAHRPAAFRIRGGGR